MGVSVVGVGEVLTVGGMVVIGDGVSGMRWGLLNGRLRVAMREMGEPG